MTAFLAPDASALPISQQLQARIYQEIAKSEKGAIPFRRYMELALYAPALGYYMAGCYRFGSGGDFITAPEKGSLFGRSLARQCDEILTAIGHGGVLEIGAGSGALAASMIKEWIALGSVPDHYWILELSGTLKEQQQQRLAPYQNKLEIRWLTAPPDQSFSGVIVANEVIDALPVTLFRITEEGIRERMVTYLPQEKRFGWDDELADNPLLSQFYDTLKEELGMSLPVGYESEIALGLPDWIKSITQTLQQGVTLWIDYGYPRHIYYHPDRNQGTLLCYYQHTAHDDPFRWPGLQDMTAFVDFTALKQAGQQAGLTPLGLTTQAKFLLGCGMLDILNQYDPACVDQHMPLAQEAKFLLWPGGMGERFLVLALGQNFSGSLRGFRSHRELI